MPRKKKPTAVSIQDLSLEELNHEIERRQEQAAVLEEERAELLERVGEIDALLQDMGAAAPRGRTARKTGRSSAKSHTSGRSRSNKKASHKTAARAGGRSSRKRGPSKPTGSRKRHRNDTNLVEALSQVLSGTTMGVSEVAQAVQDAGYKTTSPNFRTIVNQTLLKHTDVFTKKGRGQYTAK